MIRHFLLMLFPVLLTACGTTKQAPLQEAEATRYTISTELPPDSSMAAFIKPFHDSLAATMDEVAGYTAYPLEKGDPESLLGNLIADLTLATARERGIRADFAVLNTGGFRRDLPEGEITTGMLYELMPFDNELVVLELRTPQMRQLVEYIRKRGGVPVSGNILLEYKYNQPFTITVNGRLYSDQENIQYYVITTDYLANGGDNMDFWKGAPRRSLGLKLRDAIIQYFQQHSSPENPLSPELDGRIKFLE